MDASFEWNYELAVLYEKHHLYLTANRQCFPWRITLRKSGPQIAIGICTLLIPFTKFLPQVPPAPQPVFILPSRASGPAMVVVRLSGYCCVVLCVSVVLQEMLERYRILRLIKETHK